ncbi:MAG: DNRLRE domain-containing protein [Chloroflexota bacterium]
MYRHRNWLHAFVASLIGLTLLVVFALVLNGEEARAAAEISGYVDETYPRQYADVGSTDGGQAAMYHQQSVSVWFQYGVSPSQDYTGVEETFLLGEAGSEWNNYGVDAGMKVISTGIMRPLIRFDISSIPYWADVVEARLYLYANWYCERRCNDPFQVTAYKLIRPWEETEASWYMASSGDMWGQKGADDTSDRHFSAAGTTTIQETNQWYNWEITNLVQDWVSTPAQNRGMILVGSGSGLNIKRSFWTSEHGSASQLPKLMVIYEVSPDVTPEPTSTPTITPFPTGVPTPTPTPRAIITSTVSNCMTVGPAGHYPDSADLMLIWEGDPTWARLYLDEAGVKFENTILVNGQSIGVSESWDSGALCAAGHTVMWEIDPAILTPGWNTVTITDDEEAHDSWGDKTWSATNARLVVAGDLDAPRYDYRAITSSFDGHQQLAMAQVPASYTGEEDVPLLISLPWWGANHLDAVYAKGLEANERGWLLAAPGLRGQHTASLPIQHDIIDLVNVMKATYRVDPSRVYLTGPSMGGMIAATTAAKYPDVFAAVVEEKGATNLAAWHWECFNDPSQRYRSDTIEKEIGHTPATAPFEYQRRSSQSMGMNLMQVPIAMLHGTSDGVVYPHHAQDLYDAIGPSYPWVDCFYDADHHTCLCWYEGDHSTPLPYGVDWVFDFLGSYTLNDNPRELRIRTDETKSYYWLHIAQTGSVHYWTYVEANYDPYTSIINASVSDDRNSSVEISFDLNWMGLDPGVSYTVEDYDLTAGDYALSVVAPVGGILTVSVPNGNEHRFDIYPDGASTLTTLIYQQGLNGYSGVEDTYLYGYEKDRNYDGEWTLKVKHDSIYSPLIYFPLSEVPQNAVVKSALLRLYITSRNYDRTLDSTFHKMLRNWVEDEATWNQASDAEAWEEAGAKGSTDRVDLPAGTVRMESPEGWVTLNLRSLAQDWAASPEDNRGLTLKGIGSQSVIYSVASSDYSATSKRPELTLKYTLPTPTPLPTSTPTITPTPTSTSTPTLTPSATLIASPTPTATDIPQYGVVQGYIWNDVNENGRLDAGENMLAGATVVVTNAIGEEVASYLTGPDGVYYFQLLAPATYRVTEYDPPGHFSTTESTWEEHLTAGGSIEVNFGARPMPWFLPMIKK